MIERFTYDGVTHVFVGHQGMTQVEVWEVTDGPWQPPKNAVPWGEVATAALCGVRALKRLPVLTGPEFIINCHNCDTVLTLEALKGEEAYFEPFPDCDCDGCRSARGER